jgi:hypothetical protein
MEYEEPPEIIERDAEEFRNLMLALPRGTSLLIAGQLSRAYSSGRSRGRSEGALQAASVSEANHG